jgi:AhpD family alkylhydroperoxidase
VKIRTSQINGCAFCLHMHTGNALKKGGNPDRIAVLPGWKDNGYCVTSAAPDLYLGPQPPRAHCRVLSRRRRQPAGEMGDHLVSPACAVSGDGY